VSREVTDVDGDELELAFAHFDGGASVEELCEYNYDRNE
jgi:hypothetical protein